MNFFLMFVCICPGVCLSSSQGGNCQACHVKSHMACHNQYYFFLSFSSIQREDNFGAHHMTKPQGKMNKIICRAPTHTQSGLTAGDLLPQRYFNA